MSVCTLQKDKRVGGFLWFNRSHVPSEKNIADYVQCYTKHYTKEHPELFKGEPGDLRGADQIYEALDALDDKFKVLDRIGSLPSWSEVRETFVSQKDVTQQLNKDSAKLGEEIETLRGEVFGGDKSLEKRLKADTSREVHDGVQALRNEVFGGGESLEKRLQRETRGLRDEVFMGDESLEKRLQAETRGLRETSVVTFAQVKEKWNSARCVKLPPKSDMKTFGPNGYICITGEKHPNEKDNNMGDIPKDFVCQIIGYRNERGSLGESGQLKSEHDIHANDPIFNCAPTAVEMVSDATGVLSSLREVGSLSKSLTATHEGLSKKLGNVEGLSRGLSRGLSGRVDRLENRLNNPPVPGDNPDRPLGPMGPGEEKRKERGAEYWKYLENIDESKCFWKDSYWMDATGDFRNTRLEYLDRMGGCPAKHSQQSWSVINGNNHKEGSVDPRVDPAGNFGKQDMVMFRVRCCPR